MNTAKQIAGLACRALEEKKGYEISVIDIQEISSLADYFIIVSGDNARQVQALSDNVEEQLAKAGFSHKSIEGYENASWILLDYGDVIVHIFQREERRFYDLERIWRDGRLVDKAELE